MKIVDEFKNAGIEVLYEKADIFPYAFDTAPIKEEIILPLLVLFPKSTKKFKKL